jgi:GT2 family glycosyltransferase
MFSIVCVYNDKDVFSRSLLKSLQAQTAKFELIALDNSSGAFSSAAGALNHGTGQIRAESKYIMFAHQDISFSSKTWLQDIESMLHALPNLGIAGVAGNSKKANKLISNITHGMPPRHDGYNLQEPVTAMTVDECCAIVPRDVFRKHQFDDILCNNWHLYVVEYCLRVLTLGYGVFVLPVDLHHGSTGNMDQSYFKILKKVLERYKTTYPKIYTSCGSWDTATPVTLQRISYFVKKLFYDFMGWLIITGLVPQWARKKKKKILQRYNHNH